MCCSLFTVFCHLGSAHDLHAIHSRALALRIKARSAPHPCVCPAQKSQTLAPHGGVPGREKRFPSQVLSRLLMRRASLQNTSGLLVTLSSGKGNHCAFFRCIREMIRCHPFAGRFRILRSAWFSFSDKLHGLCGLFWHVQIVFGRRPQTSAHSLQQISVWSVKSAGFSHR